MRLFKHKKQIQEIIDDNLDKHKKYLTHCYGFAVDPTKSIWENTHSVLKQQKITSFNHKIINL